LDSEIVIEPLILRILKARCSLKALDAFRSKLFRDRHGIHPECPGMNGWLGWLFHHAPRPAERETKAGKAYQHHGPCGGLGNAGNRINNVANHRRLKDAEQVGKVVMPNDEIVAEIVD
jgi:hypothetical protein